MIHIGLACSYHDPAIAVVDDAGTILFAESTERPLQSKRAFHCPPDHFPHIDTVLDRFCGADEDLMIAKSWGKGANYWRRLGYALNTLSARDEPSVAAGTADQRRNRFLVMGQFANISFSGENLLRRYAERHPGRKISIAHHDHHLTHAAAACLTSPFDEAVCAVIDGFGDESSTAFYRFADGRLRQIEPEVASTNSLGHFYNRLTAACGFDPDKGEQWKVMGLAALGRIDRRAYGPMRAAFTVDGLQLAGRDRMKACPIWAEAGGLDRADLAHAGQAVFEEVLCELLRNLGSLGLSENLVLTGGCALNSTANGKVLGATGFRRLYVPSAPADDGNAIGAALLSHLAGGGRPARRGWQTPYLGSTFSALTLDRLARYARRGVVNRFEGGVVRAAAAALADGKIIGWAQGAAEFGPRALGNRSILANPTLPGVAERLRTGVKIREEFRPFAPAILHEYGGDYFQDYQESPYMERTLRFKADAAKRVPAVVHSDGSGRVQSVRRDWNPRFHGLLDRFRELTGSPVVLNTSMNISGRPIVHSVEDVVALLQTTDVDCVFVDDYCIRK